jgi:hypothetical protein
VAGSSKFSDAKIAELIRRYAGFRSKVASALGCTRQNLAYRIGGSQELQQAERETVDYLLDVAKGHIIQAIARGDLLTARWYSERFGKHRGYGKENEYVSVGLRNDKFYETLLRGVGGSVERYRAAMGIRSFPDFADEPFSRTKRRKRS